MKEKYLRRGYLRVTADTHKEGRIQCVAHINFANGSWWVNTQTIDGAFCTHSGEPFDSKEEALAYAEEVADVIVMTKDGTSLHMNTEFVSDSECFSHLYSEHVRKMDVYTDELGRLTIYSDMAYDGSGAREVRLTKEQAMWLQAILPEAIASFPEYGWEKDVKKQIRARKRRSDRHE